MLKQMIQAEGGKVAGFAVDVSSAAEVGSVWEKIGPAHILCNCAGITRDGWLTRMDEKAFDDVIGVNLKGTFLMTQGFSRQYISGKLEAGGSIINVSSMVGKTGNLGQANYAASKAGVIGFTKTAAKELARDNIRCNAVLPGFITTPMTAAVPDKVIEKIVGTVPMGRMGEASDIAEASLFLASDRSGYMTGGVVEVGGGLWM